METENSIIKPTVSDFQIRKQVCKTQFVSTPWNANCLTFFGVRGGSHPSHLQRSAWVRSQGSKNMTLLKHVPRFHMDIEDANGFGIGLSVSKRNEESHLPFEPKKQ